SRGYRTAPLPAEAVPDRITLTASDRDQVIGTISIGLDSPIGLLCDEHYLDEINMLRDEGVRVCEFTKLAMDSVIDSKRVLASLPRVLYISAPRIRGGPALVMEATPRHVRYYDRMLGSRGRGPRGMTRRVSPPAVLMALDFAHAADQIGRFGGSGDAS